jgi:hypothetical protein
MKFQFQENQEPYRTYLIINNIKLSTKFKHYVLSAKTEFNCQFTEDSKPIVKIILPPN